MTTGTVWTDTSYFQRALDMTYERQWVGFRGCDGTFLDPKFRENLAVAKRLHDAKRIIGGTVYVVYRPGKVTASVDLVRASITKVLGTLPRWVTFEIDAESWGGIGHGDRSADLNRMAALLAAYANNDLRRVMIYGNRSDLDGMWRHRMKGLHVNLASYGSHLKTYPNAIAQQYSDGQAKWGTPAGLPISSKPFGHCDHNVFPGRSPAQVALLMGVLTAAKPVAKPAPKPVVKPKPVVAKPVPKPAPKPVVKPKPVVAPVAKPVPLSIPAQIRNAAGGGYFYAQRDPATSKPAGAVYMLVGDKRYHVRSPAEHHQMNLSGVVHGLDAGHPLLAIPTL